MTNDIYEKVRPRHARIARAHGLPKTHKEFNHIPSFRPIIDTTGSPYYNIGKYISSLINPLTQNEFVLRDSFDAVERIKSIPSSLFNEGYKLVSFDVTSLFTNVPLDFTIDIILDRIYDKNFFNTNIKKNTMRKLLKDICTKTAFSFNGKIFKQIDGVSMGASLGPVLSNIFMTELEKSVIQQFIEVIKFYSRYVDDTLVLIKEEHVNVVHEALNRFHSNIKFTVDKFENETPHFLDIEIAADGLSIYHKETQTGQYIHFKSNTPWMYKTAWISALVYRAKSICSSNKFSAELKRIRKFISWNGFPKHIGNKIITKTLEKHQRKSDQNERKQEKNDDKIVYFHLPYVGLKGEQLAKSCIRKLKKCIKKKYPFASNCCTQRTNFRTLQTIKIELKNYNNQTLFTNSNAQVATQIM